METSIEKPSAAAFVKTALTSFYAPALGGLANGISDSRRLSLLHAALRRQFPEVERVAVALYDPRTRLVSTFLAHDARPTRLWFYQARLEDVPGLRKVLRTRKIRVVRGLHLLVPGPARHHKALRASGYRSSATFPIFRGRRLEGFVFFNSRRAGAFGRQELPLLEAFAQLVADEAMSRVRSARLLRAALRTAVAMVHARDPGTGSHVDRMGLYAGLIARELARSGKHRFTDETIRAIEEFAPLHDVGKLGVPDRVLLKRGPLGRAERRLMESHTTKGRELIDAILRDFSAGTTARADTLRQIAEHHHETMDGTGYPHGLCGRRIPIEARIAAVADVFDALTTARSYKDAWPLDRAFRELRRLAGSRLDADCVEALERSRPAIERLRRRFAGEGSLPLRRARRAALRRH